jgi:alkanesulfonate monooxygenase SsuD/methylene tetrahydromethanopterin reductase-like flavin-dependent oxidoreductase (luciferase family)
MPGRKALFGIGSSVDVRHAYDVVRLAQQADQAGLDLFSVPDHPYIGQRLDAYATLGVVLGHTLNIAGVADVTNLPTRPAPMLARAATSLAALSGGRFVLGIGAGGYWDEIVRMGVPRLSPGAAVTAMEEAITLVKALSAGGSPVSFDGEHYRVTGIDPAPVPAPPIWTGSVGARSLAVTGRLADGWIPGRASDWLSDLYRRSRPLIDAAAIAAGRDPSAIDTIYNFPGEITTKPRSVVRDQDGRWIGGSVGQWVDELTSAVVDHGASGFIMFPSGNDPVDVTIGRWAGEIAPAVREAVVKELRNA